MSVTSPWRVARRIGIAVSAVGCAGMVLLLATAALRPGQPLPVPLAAFWDPRSWQVVTIAAAWAALLVTFILLGRRRPQSARPLMAIVVMGSVAVILSFVSYVPCVGNGVGFWTPLSWAFAVFVESAADPWGTNSGCPAQPPLALLVARLLAIATVGLGFVAAAALLFRSQLDVLRMRRARSRVVVDGPLDVTLPASTRIRDRVAPGTLVVVRSDASDPPPPLQRQPGVVLLRWSDPADAALRTFSLRRGRVALTALYLLGDDAAANLSRFERLAEELRASAPVPAGDIRAVVRIDDVWIAEYWRRQQVDRRGWALDAIGVHEATAQRLVTRWTADGHDRAAVHGDPDLILAVAAEVAQRGREFAACRAVGLTLPPRIVIVGPNAAALRRQHELHQRAFGNLGAGIAAHECDDASAGFAVALAGARSPAIMTAPVSASAGPRPAELAAAHPEWPVYARVSESGALPSEPVMERLFPFALGFGEGRVIDRWERIARIAHANFLADHGIDHDNPARRPWDDGLPDFYKESNIRLVRTTLSSAVAAGRSWGPLPPGADPADTRPTEEQLVFMAQREHDSWSAALARAGWRQGPRRDDERRMHTLLVPWSALDESAQAKTRQGVLDSLELLRALGYASRPQTTGAHRTRDLPGQSGAPASRRYRRRGDVRAEQVDAPWRWTTQSGSVMHAQAGDWRVSDGDRSWSVRPAEFAASYAEKGNGRWQRTGAVRAHRADAAEVVETLEGQTSVAPGDWVVEGARGERWTVPDAHFARWYELDE